MSSSLINFKIFMIIVKEKLQLSGTFPKIFLRDLSNDEHIAPKSLCKQTACRLNLTLKCNAIFIRMSRLKQ